MRASRWPLTAHVGPAPRVRCFGCAEDGHQSVTSELGDDTTLGFDDVAHRGHVFVDDLAQRFGVDLVGERGEPRDVRGQRGDPQALWVSDSLRIAGFDPRCHRCRCIPAKQPLADLQLRLLASNGLLGPELSSRAPLDQGGANHHYRRVREQHREIGPDPSQ